MPDPARELIAWLDSYSEMLVTTRRLAHLAERLVAHSRLPGHEVDDARSQLQATRTIVDQLDGIVRARRHQIRR